MDEDADGNVTLTLTEVTPEDAGTFKVKAINSYGEADSFAQLNVKTVKQYEILTEEEEKGEEDDSPPVFTKKFNDVTTKENEQVVFTCAVEGKPKPEVSNNTLQNDKLRIRNTWEKCI